MAGAVMLRSPDAGPAVDEDGTYMMGTNGRLAELCPTMGERQLMRQSSTQVVLSTPALSGDALVVANRGEKLRGDSH